MARQFLLFFYAFIMFSMVLSGSAQAVSVGKVEVASHLGEPFYAEIPLLLETEEVVSNISADIAGVDDYRVLEVYRDPALKQIKTWLKTDDRGSRIEVSSNAKIDTPFFNLVLKIRYAQATHFKKFVIFLEMPTTASVRRVTDVSSTKAPKASRKSASPKPSVAVKPQSGKKATSTPAKAMNASSPIMKNTLADHSAKRVNGWARAETYGPIVRGDTITTVAQRLRIDGTFTNAQVMIALYEKNRAKFGEQNINMIKAGTFLEIPSADEVRRNSSSAASKMLMKQNILWKKLVQKPKYADIAKAQRNRYRPHVRIGNTGSGIAAKPMKAASDKGKAAAPVKKADAGKATATSIAAANKNKAAFAANTRVRKALELENKNLKAKLLELEKNNKIVASAEKSALTERNNKLELKIVRLQAELDKLTKQAHSVPTPATKPVVTPPAVVTVKPTKVEPTKVKPAVALPTPATKPVVKKPVPTKQAVVEDEDLLFGLPLLWVAAALLILLVLIAVAFILIRKKVASRKSAATAGSAAAAAAVALNSGNSAADEFDTTEFDASEFEAAELLAEADADAARTEPVQTTQADLDYASSMGVSTKLDLPVEQIPALTDEDTSEFDAFVEKDEVPSSDVDYLTEADVYLRYGMEDEAEEQVVMALKLNKSDENAHIKMLQIRHARGEQSGIEGAISQARAVLAGTALSSFEAEVNELGVDASGVKAAIPSEETMEIPEEAGISNELDFDIGAATETAEVAIDQAKDAEDDLDFNIDDFDLSSLDAEPEAATASSSSDDGDGLDFDIGDLDLSSLDTDADSTSEVTSSENSSDSSDDLDFDLGELDLSTALDSAESESATTPADSDDGLDFDFNMDDLSFDEETTPSNDTSSNIDVESTELNFDDDSMSIGDDLSMLDMSFDDLTATASDDIAVDSDDETIVSNVASSSADLNDSDLESLDFISTITMEGKKQESPIEFAGPDISQSLDSMSLLADDITPALLSMANNDVEDDELTKTLSTMSMLVDDMDTSEISIESIDDTGSSELMNLSLSTGELDVSMETSPLLDDDDPDLTSLLGELEEITGLNEPLGKNS